MVISDSGLRKLIYMLMMIIPKHRSLRSTANNPRILHLKAWVHAFANYTVTWGRKDYRHPLHSKGCPALLTSHLRPTPCSRRSDFFLCLPHPFPETLHLPVHNIGTLGSHCPPGPRTPSSSASPSLSASRAAPWLYSQGPEALCHSHLTIPIFPFFKVHTTPISSVMLFLDTQYWPSWNLEMGACFFIFLMYFKYIFLKWFDFCTSCLPHQVVCFLEQGPKLSPLLNPSKHEVSTRPRPSLIQNTGHLMSPGSSARLSVVEEILQK